MCVCVTGGWLGDSTPCHVRAKHPGSPSSGDHRETGEDRPGLMFAARDEEITQERDMERQMQTCTISRHADVSIIDMLMCGTFV